MAYQYLFTFSLLAFTAFTLVALGVAIWVWSAFLDRYEHDPGRVRAVMFVLLASAMAIELCLALSGVTSSWVAWVSFVVNLWGGLDAVLRFPGAREVESFFTAKQITLLLVKTFAYCAGFVSIKQHLGTFLMVLAFNIWGLPVFYFMALPLDPSEQVLKDDDDDVDLAIRVWQLAMCSAERRRCLTCCKTWMARRLVAASENSSLARLAVCATSPQYRRTAKRGGRSV